MAELFSEAWMGKFRDEWNNEPELAGALEKIKFNSVIAYGFDGEDQPRGVIKVENGKVVEAGTYKGGAVNWDLRASQESWEEWLKKEIGTVGLGVAYTSRKLKFNSGDYAAMIKDPRMAGPFVKSFSVMGRASK